VICDLPSTDIEIVVEDSFLGESLFLIIYDNIWYGDIIIYLQTQTLWPGLSVWIVVVFGIKPFNTLSLVIPFTVMVLIPYFNDV
jgi:hypothetical protein